MLRVLLCLFSLQIAGIAVLGVGITALVFFEKFVPVTGSGILSTPIAIVVVGVIIIIVAFLGFMGAIRESASLVMAVRSREREGCDTCTFMHIHSYMIHDFMLIIYVKSRNDITK